LNITTGTIAVTCAVDPVEVAKTTCTAAAMDDCLQNVCTFDGTSTYAKLCGMCASGKAGTTGATNVAGLGSADCIATDITNCAFAFVAAASTVNNCYSCSTGYAVASTLLTCTAYTTDTNCRVLLADGACGECVTGYYWNGAICGLTALVSVLSTMSLAILALLN